MTCGAGADNSGALTGDEDGAAAGWLCGALGASFAVVVCTAAAALTLGADAGEQLTLEGSGSAAQAAVDAIEQLFLRKFDED